MEELIDIALQNIAKNIFGYAATCACAYFCAKYKESKKREEEAVELAKLGREIEVMMARNTIQYVCTKHILEGWIDIKEKENILSLHDAYDKIIKTLGLENGTTDDCVEQMRHLPNNPPKE